MSPSYVGVKEAGGSQAWPLSLKVPLVTVTGRKSPPGPLSPPTRAPWKVSTVAAAGPSVPEAANSRVTSMTLVAGSGATDTTAGAGSPGSGAGPSSHGLPVTVVLDSTPTPCGVGASDAPSPAGTEHPVDSQEASEPTLKDTVPSAAW